MLLLHHPSHLLKVTRFVLPPYTEKFYLKWHILSVKLQGEEDLMIAHKFHIECGGYYMVEIENNNSNLSANSYKIVKMFY